MATEPEPKQRRAEQSVFPTDGQANLGRGLSAVCFAEWSQGQDGSGTEAKHTALRTRWETPVSENSERGMERNGGASRWSGSLAAPQWSGVSGLNFRSHAPAGEREAARARKGVVLRDGGASNSEGRDYDLSKTSKLLIGVCRVLTRNTIAT